MFSLAEAPIERWFYRSAKPLDVQRLEFKGGALWFALVNPLFEAPTAEMRAALPKTVPMASQIHNAAMGGTLVSVRSAPLKAVQVREAVLHATLGNLPCTSAQAVLFIFSSAGRLTRDRSP